MCLMKKKKKKSILNIIMKSRILKHAHKNMQMMHEKLKQKFESWVMILGKSFKGMICIYNNISVACEQC